MGQRLNVEIKKKDKVLANCYYHWGAYSDCAVDLALLIIKKFDYIKEYKKIDTVENQDLLFAIRLLEQTGAGVEDIEETRNLLGNQYINLQPCKSRNDGIIRSNRKTNTKHKRLGRVQNNNRH